jgi:hypothetical protein
MQRSRAPYLRAALAVAGVAAGAWFALHSARAIAFPFPLDYAEGPLLEQARLLAAGGSIYRADLGEYPFTVANYPPVFVGLLAVVCKLWGLRYGVARVVTVAAALGCAGLVGVIAWTTSRDRLAAWVAAGAFLASPYVVFWSQLVRIDFVALAFSLGAVLLVLRRPAGRATPLLAAVLLALAVLTRQSHLLAGPLAVTGALAARSARSAALFVVVFAGLVVGAVLSLDAATHGGFWFDTVRANENPFSSALLGHFLRDLVVASPVLLVLAAVLAWMRARERAAGSLLLGLYLVGTSLSALTIGKVGSHVNYLLELTASLSIFAGVGVARMSRPGHTGALVLGLVLVQIGWLIGRTVLLPDPIESKLRQGREFALLDGVLRAEHGTVLADEAMGMLVLSSHPILLQPFELTQLSRQGAWDQAPVVADIRGGRFALILINDGPDTPSAWTRERWTAEMLGAIHQAYVPAGALAHATLYRPRPELP